MVSSYEVLQWKYPFLFPICNAVLLWKNTIRILRVSHCGCDTKPATFVYLRVLKTDQLSLLSWASSSSWNTAVCSGSFESLSFHSKITASVQKVIWLIKVVSLLKYCSYLCSLRLCTMRDIPSPPEASNSPFGLKRTTLTALVCLARLDRNSTTAFPSPSVSTRHNCSTPKYTVSFNQWWWKMYPNQEMQLFPHKSASTTSVKEICFLTHILVNQ